MVGHEGDDSSGSGELAKPQERGVLIKPVEGTAEDGKIRMEEFGWGEVFDAGTEEADELLLIDQLTEVLRGYFKHLHFGVNADQVIKMAGEGFDDLSGSGSDIEQAVIRSGSCNFSQIDGDLGGDAGAVAGVVGSCACKWPGKW